MSLSSQTFKTCYWLVETPLSGTAVLKSLCVRVCVKCDSTGPTLSSNEREGLCALSPPMKGVRWRTQSGEFSGVRKYFDFRPCFFSLNSAVMIISKLPIALLLEWKCLHRVV